MPLSIPFQSLAFGSTAAGGYYTTIFLGDSLTWGYGGEDILGPYLPYPDQMSEFMPFRQFENQGVSGETSAQIYSRFVAHPEWLEHAMVIWTGRNDISLDDNWSNLYTLPKLALMKTALDNAGNPNWLFLGVTASFAALSGS